MSITDADVTRVAYQISEEYPEGLRNALLEFMDDHPGAMLIYGDHRELPGFITGERNVRTYTVYAQWGALFLTISWTIDEKGEFSSKAPIHNWMTVHELEIFRKLSEWSGR